MFNRIGMTKYKGNEAYKRNLITCVLASLVVVALSFVLDLTVSTMVASGQSRYNSLFRVDFYEQAFEYAKTMPIKELVIKGLKFMVPVFYTMALTFCLQILFTNPINVSFSRFFLENHARDVEGKKVFFVFKNGYYPTVAWKMFLRDLYVFGWSLLFLIPGILKAYSYRMVPILLAENPDLDRKRVFEISEKMMKGHRMEFFLLELSFIGWVLVGMFTRGIVNAVYTNPYMQATYSQFYFERKEEAKQHKIFKQDELPVFDVKKGKVTML